MSDKIIITNEEIEQKNNIENTKTEKIIIEYPPDNTPRTTSDSKDNRLKTNNNSKKLFIICGIIAIIIISAILIYTANQREIILMNQETVEDWCAKTRKELNKELSNTDSTLRKRIEDAHLTVTVTMAEIKSLVATTLDGTNNSDNGENISSCTVIIEFRWDGVFQQGGYTILEMIFDVQNKKVIKSNIVDTNAVINFEDPTFWFNAGWIIGSFL